METEIKEQREKLKKCSTEQLRRKVARYPDMDEEVIAAAPREEVMNWVLQLKGLTAGGSLPKKVVATETKVTTLDPMQVLIAMQTMMREERDQTMQLQREKEQQEREERERLMQQQMEERERIRAIEGERWRAEMELKQRKQDDQERAERARVQQAQDDKAEEVAREDAKRAADQEKETRRREEQNKKSERLHQASKKLDKLLPKMGVDGMEMPIYFRNVENYFREFNVDEDLKIALLLPHLNEKATRVVIRLDDTQRANYEEVKRQILREFKLTPRVYRTRFNEANKGVIESWTQFASRLDIMFTYYTDSRKVKTLAELRNLIIADKMKDVMPVKIKEFIIGNEGDEWLTPKQLADRTDTYATNIQETQQTWSRTREASGAGTNGVNSQYSYSGMNHFSGRGAGIKKVTTYENCYRPQNNYRSPGNMSHPNSEYRFKGNPNMNVRRVQREELPQRVENIRPPSENKPNINERLLKISNCHECNSENLVHKNGRKTNPTADQSNSNPITDQFIPDLTGVANPTADRATLKISVLGGAEIMTPEIIIEIKDSLIRCVVDSGADITVINSKCVPPCFSDPSSRIRLKGAFGQIIEADLLSVPVCLHVKKSEYNSMKVNSLITVAATHCWMLDLSAC